MTEIKMSYPRLVVPDNRVYHLVAHMVLVHVAVVPVGNQVHLGLDSGKLDSVLVVDRSMTSFRILSGF